jgi:hypothetical protein
MAKMLYWLKKGGKAFFFKKKHEFWVNYLVVCAKPAIFDSVTPTSSEDCFFHFFI